MGNVSLRVKRHYIIVLNQDAGTIVRLGKEHVIDVLTKAFSETEVEMTLQCVAAADLKATLEKAADSEADAVIIGGGDGTVASAATLLASKGKVMGILPLGTFNLAARDLGVPLDLAEAAAALATANVTKMDAMELNGRLYLCLMVLGFYPALKLANPEHHGWWIIRALHNIRDSLRHAATFPALELSLVQDGKTIQSRSRVALIANNDYKEVFGVIPQRTSLDAGYFTVYLSRHRTRWGMVRSFLAWTFVRWRQDREVTRVQTTELEIHAKRKRVLPVMMDGEVQRVPLPLHIKIKPRALSVLAPAPTV